MINELNIFYDSVNFCTDPLAERIYKLILLHKLHVVKESRKKNDILEKKNSIIIFLCIVARSSKKNHKRKLKKKGLVSKFLRIIYFGKMT